MTGADSIHEAPSFPQKAPSLHGKTGSLSERKIAEDHPVGKTSVQNMDWISLAAVKNPKFYFTLSKQPGDSIPEVMIRYINNHLTKDDPTTTKQREILSRDPRRNEGVIEALVETATQPQEFEKLLQNRFASQLTYTKAAEKAAGFDEVRKLIVDNPKRGIEATKALIATAKDGPEIDRLMRSYPHAEVLLLAVQHPLADKRAVEFAASKANPNESELRRAIESSDLRTEISNTSLIKSSEDSEEIKRLLGDNLSRSKAVEMASKTSLAKTDFKLRALIRDHEHRSVTSNNRLIETSQDPRELSVILHDLRIDGASIEKAAGTKQAINIHGLLRDHKYRSVVSNNHLMSISTKPEEISSILDDDKTNIDPRTVEIAATKVAPSNRELWAKVCSQASKRSETAEQTLFSRATDEEALNAIAETVTPSHSKIISFIASSPLATRATDKILLKKQLKDPLKEEVLQKAEQRLRVEHVLQDLVGLRVAQQLKEHGVSQSPPSTSS